MKLVLVESLDELRKLAEVRPVHGRIALNGGTYSRKSVYYRREDRRWLITNHIDDSEQTLSEVEVLDPSATIIPEAIALGAFWIETEA